MARSERAVTRLAAARTSLVALSRSRLSVAEAPLRSRWPSSSTAAVVHVASLVVAFGLLLYTARDQWFFADDWAAIARQSVVAPEIGLFEPHNEHWVTGQTLIYRSLFSVFGVRSYVPYMTVVLLLHVGVGHVLWRVLRSAGVGPWVATGLVCTFLVAGKGAENVMWAFQIAFVGALLLGLLALLLANHAGPASGRDVVATVAATGSVTFAGISLPLIAAAGLVAWMRRGPRAAARLVAPPVLVYLGWLVLIGHEGVGTHPVTKRGMLLVPEYLWHGLVTTIEGYTALTGAGPVLLIGLGWFLLRRTGWGRTGSAAAPAAAAGAVLLYLTVAPGRVAFGVEQAGESRYAYLVWALLLPALGVALHEFVAGSRRRLVAVLTLTAMWTIHGVGPLLDRAESEAANEQALRGRILASAELATSGATVFPLPPHRVFAPNLNPVRLSRLDRAGALPRRPHLTAADRLAAAGALQVRLPPHGVLPVDETSPPVVRELVFAIVHAADPGCLTIRPQGGRPQVTLSVSRPSGIQVTPSASGDVGVLLLDTATGLTHDPGVTATLAAGMPAVVDLAVTTFRTVLLLPDETDTLICGVRLD